MTDDLIAVTGATGSVGGRVAARLARGGVAQRLIVRDPARAPRLPGADVRSASGFHDAEEMRRALDGVHALFFVPASESQQRVEDHAAAIDSAVGAGVERVVYLSFVQTSPDATFTLARDHWATEERVRASGLKFTFLRMNTYLDFIPLLVSADGVIAGPAGDGRVSAVLRDDLAAVSVAVLTSNGHDGETYDVTGRIAFTLTEAAATMSHLSGKQIVFRNETLDEAWASRTASGAAHWEIEGWVSSYTAIASGVLATVSDAVKRLAGHEPLTLEEFVATNPHCLDHVVGRRPPQPAQ